MICEPVAVAPKVAFEALGIGNTKGYELLASGELESFYIGRSRRVVWESVKRLARQSSASGAEAA